MTRCPRTAPDYRRAFLTTIAIVGAVDAMLSTALPAHAQDTDSLARPTAQELLDDFRETHERNPLQQLLSRCERDPQTIEKVAAGFARMVAGLNHEAELCAVFDTLIRLDPVPGEVLRAVAERFTRPAPAMRYAKAKAAAILIRSGFEKERAQDWLRIRLASPDQSVRLRAAAALSRAGESASDCLADVRPLLTDESDVVRVAAARAVWQISREPDDIISVLLHALKEPDERYITRPVYLSEVGVETKWSMAVSCLGEMPSRKAEIADAIVQLLHDELDDEIIPIIALRAIAKLHVHSTGAERVLRGILACRPEPCLRDEAQAALEALESVANSSEARSPAGRG